MCHLKALQKKGLIHREPNMSRAIQLLDDPTTAPPAGVKMLGRIAAGSPIEAIEQDEELAFTEWQGADDKFALRVAGDSMIDAHIADGDYVVIHRQEQARDGQIVAVRDDNGEATLKRFFKEKNRVRLEPANKTMKPIYRDRVSILGVLVGRRPKVLIRPGKERTLLALPRIRIDRASTAVRPGRPWFCRARTGSAHGNGFHGSRRFRSAVHRRCLQRQPRPRGLGVHPRAPRQRPESATSRGPSPRPPTTGWS